MSKKRNKYHLLMIEQTNNNDEIPNKILIQKKINYRLINIFYSQSWQVINN